MEKELGIRTFQQFIHAKDHDPEQKEHYFYKLIEEIGELSEVIRKNHRLQAEESIKGTIEEELHDILYYTLALANVYEIDMEACCFLKDEINARKYQTKTLEHFIAERPKSLTT